jgi:hypothetical protein
MTKRSVRDAFEVLDKLPFDNSAKEQEARTHADLIRDDRIEQLAVRTIHANAADIAERRDRHVAELEVLGNAQVELAKALRDGDLDAAQAGRRWIELRTRRRALLERSAALIDRVADTTARYEDPADYLHSLETRFPSVQHEWPW